MAAPSDMNLLDPAWIANILSISFTIVVFLLGLPMLFLQTFVPEELRKHYRKLQHDDKKATKIVAWLLLMAILIFGNHGVKYLLETQIPSTYLVYIHGTVINVTHRSIIVSYYLLSLVFFIFLANKVYVTFSKGAFREENIKNKIIELAFARAASDLSVAKLKRGIGISNETLLELIDIGEIFDDGIDRLHYNNHVFKLVEEIAGRTDYSGEGIKVIFDGIIFPFFINRHGYMNYATVAKLFTICQKIALKYQANPSMKSFDSEYLINFLFHLCIKYIRMEELNLADKCLKILLSFNAEPSIYYKIFFTAFESKYYNMVLAEINRSVHLLECLPETHPDKLPSLYNVIAYLSLFNGGNKEMKNYAFRYAKRLGNSINISISIAAKKYFLREGKFDTANKISDAIKEYYGIRRPYL